MKVIKRLCHTKRVLWNILFVRNICRPQSTSRDPLYLSFLRSVKSNGANMNVQPITKLNSPSDIWNKKIVQHQGDCSIKWGPAFGAYHIYLAQWHLQDEELGHQSHECQLLCQNSQRRNHWNFKENQIIFFKNKKKVYITP